MSTKGEKTSSAMGVVVSVLLHGIFFAGCLALDASSVTASDTAVIDQTEVPQGDTHPEAVKVKS
ncbi:MAG TPA: hypothetical protein VLA46_00945 [Saprospiraceae bacterium]|nr:hypothetical protein [Saprospiraceae bacterium]